MSANIEGTNRRIGSAASVGGKTRKVTDSSGRGKTGKGDEGG